MKHKTATILIVTVVLIGFTVVGGLLLRNEYDKDKIALLKKQEEVEEIVKEYNSLMISANEKILEIRKKVLDSKKLSDFYAAYTKKEMTKNYEDTLASKVKMEELAMKLDIYCVDEQRNDAIQDYCSKNKLQNDFFLARLKSMAKFTNTYIEAFNQSLKVDVSLERKYKKLELLEGYYEEEIEQD